jgi:hypothetical protein
MAEVVFDIDGRLTAVADREAMTVGERLRCFAAGAYREDVEELTRSGTDPGWLEGARAMADAIEDVLTETRCTPIPLDRGGRAASALVQVLRLTPATDTSGVSRLHAALTRSTGD